MKSYYTIKWEFSALHQENADYADERRSSQKIKGFTCHPECSRGSSHNTLSALREMSRQARHDK